MNPGQAFLGGVAGAALSILLTGVARALGLPVNVGRFLGWFAGTPVGVDQWAAGLLLALAGGGALGLVYGVLLAPAPERAQPLIGLGLGVVQAGVVLVVVPRLPAPGWPGTDFTSLAVLVGVQVAYGATVGLLHAATSPAASALALWDDAARGRGPHAADPAGPGDVTTRPAV